MPNSIAASSSRSRDNPPGWHYNPSSWPARVPIAIVAFFAGAAALYLALYQFGVTRSVWDPIYGSDGSRRVLFSPISELFHSRDAVLGAAAYFSESITSLIGGTRRYERMPWMVFLFGCTCMPFTFVALTLLFAMPAIVHSWCFLCIVASVFSAVLTPFAWDEIWASVLAIRRMQREGATFWAAFSGRAARAVH
jgi:uncharacterized membrane protein